MIYSSIEELISEACNQKTTISEIVILDEMREWDLTRETVFEKMRLRLKVMREAIEKGLTTEVRSITGLSGGDARKIDRIQFGIMDGLYKKVIASAVATSEVNASMGRIVGSPTAGSGGILPAVVLGIADSTQLSDDGILLNDRENIQGDNQHVLNDDKVILSLFTAGGLGEVVSKKMNLAGAAGGCQAECGVASAMAAGAAVELLGGDPEMVGHGFALALKNMLGLTCDPVAGLVEVPCIKRNGFAASHALTAAFMALSGVESIIPPDQVVDAMYQTGKLMPESLKETSQAGLACTRRGLEIKDFLNNLNPV